MSWRGFKKAVNRAATSVMQSAGAIEKTVDRDYEEEEKRFKNFEAKIERLHKDSKGYLDSVRAMTLAQQRLAETLETFQDQSSPLAPACLRYKDAMRRIDEESRSELDAAYRKTVLDPIGRLVGTFPEYNDAIKRRQKKLLDYDRVSHEVRKMVENPSADATRVPKAQEEGLQARDAYEQINQQLIEDIPKLLDLRIPYLDPSLEAMIKSQLRFNESVCTKLESVQLDSHDTNVDEWEQEIQYAIQQMRELTICRSMQGQA
ncbi:uncharacterized protein BJ171DRAFT_487878 [Polychytrium aggregatum]|uniref:uncharacterized protein n=1 Tax=Polychytrium aggregatum TaxID=110093 RepID=UPI0022FE8358|nr:uncharacterized protein BJ171DRAFT_487878 [Polychytrium aggregatum]KAI9208939.1 hypothetical protein BJ171DRAFT_487878 [Polychytrium aggregatum]